MAIGGSGSVVPHGGRDGCNEASARLNDSSGPAVLAVARRPEKVHVLSIDLTARLTGLVERHIACLDVVHPAVDNRH